MPITPCKPRGIVMAYGLVTPARIANGHFAGWLQDLYLLMVEVMYS